VKTRYGLSPWIHQFPSQRRPDFPRLRGEMTADVVIMGGGLTGCTTAQACAAAGMKVILVERDRVGQGSSGRSAGVLLPDPGPGFREVAATNGLRAARQVFEQWRRGALDAAALLRRLKVRCGLEPATLVAFAGRGDEKEFRKEYEARQAAGLDVAWLSPKQVRTLLNVESPVGARLRDSFTLDPYAACVGMAAAAARRGAEFFERSPVTRVRFSEKQVEVTTASGVVVAETIVVSTGSATAEFRSLRRHFKRRESYQVLTAPLAAPMRKQVGAGDTIRRDARSPHHLMRRTSDDRLLLGGADQDETPEKKRGDVRVQRTGQLMYELLTMHHAISGLQPEYGWETPYGETADGLMYIGAHRNYPRHLFALGGGRESVTGSFVAARVLLRALQDQSEKSDRVFGWGR
jgi:glycine/D-amino acid oxidase-like deaminating enzyme